MPLTIEKNYIKNRELTFGGELEPRHALQQLLLIFDGH